MKSILLSLVFLLFSISVSAETDFKNVFNDRDACFLISDLKTGEILTEYNPTRCQERVTPCSSFKIAAALMAFEKNVLKDENQIIKWDRIQHSRKEENRDQTPLTWMSDSVGVFKANSKNYVFAANAADLKNQEHPAGPRLRNTIIEILKNNNLDH